MTQVSTAKYTFTLWFEQKAEGESLFSLQINYLTHLLFMVPLEIWNLELILLNHLSGGCTFASPHEGT